MHVLKFIMHQWQFTKIMIDQLHTNPIQIVHVTKCPYQLLSVEICSIGNIVAGQHIYMAELHAQVATATGSGPRFFIPAKPLVIGTWQQAMQNHPGKEFASYILFGITCGFHIGADRLNTFCSQKKGNLSSVQQLPSLVAEHLPVK